MAHDKPPFIVHHFDSIGSTNDYLKELADAPEWTVVVADEQTAGRGRRERTWHSTRGEGLYFSVLLRPPRSAQLLSLLASIGVAEALVNLGLVGVDIKWPNDVLIGERKICGILCEGAGSSVASSRVVVGVGINLSHAQFPADLTIAATSILIETGRRIESMSFLDAVLQRILAWYRVLISGGDARIVERWEELSTYAFGQRVRISTDAFELNGVTSGLTSAGGLVVVDDTGQAQTVLVGEVSRMRRTNS